MCVYCDAPIVERELVETVEKTTWEDKVIGGPIGKAIGQVAAVVAIAAIAYSVSK